MKKVWKWILRIFSIIGITLVTKGIISLITGSPPDTDDYEDAKDTYNETKSTNDSNEVRREDYETDDADYEESIDILNDILGNDHGKRK